jgi:hypothetical protein
MALPFCLFPLVILNSQIILPLQVGVLSNHHFKNACLSAPYPEKTKTLNLSLPDTLPDFTRDACPARRNSPSGSTRFLVTLRYFSRGVCFAVPVPSPGFRQPRSRSLASLGKIPAVALPLSEPLGQAQFLQGRHFAGRDKHSTPQRGSRGSITFLPSG